MKMKQTLIFLIIVVVLTEEINMVVSNPKMESRKSDTMETLIFANEILGVTTTSNKENQWKPKQNKNEPPTKTYSLKPEDNYQEIMRELQDEALEEFKKILLDLDDVKNVVNHTSPRKPRAAPVLGKRKECKISKSELINLKNSIEITLTKLKNVNQDSRCEPNFANNDNCEELLELIKCGVDHIRNLFSQPTVSIEEWTKLQAAYESLQEKYTKEIDNIKNSLSQEAGRKIDKLETDMQNLQNTLNEKINKLKEMMREMCISNIVTVHIEKAMSNYNEIKQDYDLEDIIRTSYNTLKDGYSEKKDKLNNVEGILKFSRKLPTSESSLAQRKLYKEMESNSHMNTPEILAVKYELEKLTEKSDYVNRPETEKNKLKLMKTILIARSGSVIDSWKMKLRRGNDWHEILEFAKRYYESFSYNLNRIISRAYSSYNVQRLIEFIQMLPYSENFVIGYASLLHLMKINSNVCYGMIPLIDQAESMMKLSQCNIK